MSRRLLAAALVATALQLPLSPAFAADAPLTGDKTAAAQVWSEFERWLRSYETGDLDQTMAIFDPEIVFEFQGGPDSGAEMLRRDYATDFKSRAPGTRWVPRVEEVHAEGGTAFVRAVWELHVGDKVTQRNRSMDVFHQRDGHWRILRSINYPEVGRKAC